MMTEGHSKNDFRACHAVRMADSTPRRQAGSSKKNSFFEGTTLEFH
jgi:hypothetical protein